MTPIAEDTRNSHVRFWIIAILFMISSIAYASRATLQMAGTPLSAEFHLDKVQLGYLFSAFAWSYAIAQIPGAPCWTNTGRAPFTCGPSSCGPSSPGCRLSSPSCLSCR